MQNKNNFFPNFKQSILMCLLLLFISVLISILIPLIKIENNDSILMIWMNLPIFALIFIVGLLWSGESIDVFIKNSPDSYN